ncbi:expressed unknown protein [Seminavis robusta]|uniref:Uncharacterized protein n=1 Tax=Seminavis robusta TaxID=568900 RepID=A0A9N8DXC9_9STRA|nr:expressed unknown protein [Seminavis robusta]|eukprot:Sro426_g140470.1 n/a (204) ;mRNA; r:42091-42702
MSSSMSMRRYGQRHGQLSLPESIQRTSEIDQQSWISIQNLPRNVPISILTNAVALYVSLPLGLSLKFIVSHDGSEWVELYDYHDARVGRIWLIRQHKALLCDGHGFFQFVKGCSLLNKIATVEYILNQVVQKEPLKAESIQGKLVKAKAMVFSARSKSWISPDANEQDDKENTKKETKKSVRFAADDTEVKRILAKYDANKGQ